MNEIEIYKSVLDSVFRQLKTEKYEKFKNDRTSERNFAVHNLYPDIILTKKDSKVIEFIIEIVPKKHVNKESLRNKWKPLSEIGISFYIIVPQENRKEVEKWCLEEKIRARIATYEVVNDEPILNFK